MSKKLWKSFCIVGSGFHVVDKLIPALIKSNKLIKGIVTSKPKESLLKFKNYSTIASSLKTLPKDTAFIIATPPSLHFTQAKEIIENGRDVIVEKPICLKVKELEKICSILNDDKNVVLEAFMHRYTKMYSEFIKFWRINKHQVIKLKSSFYIPDLPIGTFRDNKDISSSCLYDIGCYSLSLLNDLDLDLDKIQIEKFKKKDFKISCIQLKGKIKNLSVELNFGQNKIYENFVEVTTLDNNRLSFTPFFYGRKKKKSIINFKNDIMLFSHIYDCNAFEKMFSQDVNQLRYNQKNRFKNMLIVTKKLEKLAFELK